MEAIRRTTHSQAAVIVHAALVAAAYAVITLALAPLSYGPLQFRVSGLLKPLALASPIMAWGLAVGVALANLMSPFGMWDFVAMPIVSFGAARVAWWLRRWPWLAMVVQAGIIAVGVAVFPLYLGGGIPILSTLPYVFAAECTLYLIGYALLRNTPLMR